MDSIVLISAEDNKWKVEGQVRDENGQALSGASVIIKETYLGAYTGRDGAFSFKSVVEGEYILRVSYMGYSI